MTQPVFTAELARKVIEACSGIDIKIFIGVFPLVSSRNAEFYGERGSGDINPE